jgi:hypothetical protein
VTEERLIRALASSMVWDIVLFMAGGNLPFYRLTSVGARSTLRTVRTA